MSKKILVVFLAAVLVFAFAATAMAGESVTKIFIDGDEITASSKTIKLDSKSDTITAEAYSVEVSEGVEGTKTDLTVSISEVSGVAIEEGVISFSEEGKYTFDVEAGDESIALTVYVGSANAAIDYITADKAMDDDGDELDCKSSAVKSGTVYTVYVDEGTETVDVKIVLDDSDAQVTYKVADGDESERATGSVEIEGADATKTYTIKVYPENGEDAASYTLKFDLTYDKVDVADLKLNGTLKESSITNKEVIDDNDGIYYAYGAKAGDVYEFTFGTLVGDLSVDVASADEDYVDIDYITNGFKVTFVAAPAGTVINMDVEVVAMDGKSDIEFDIDMHEADPILLSDLDIRVGSTSTSSDLSYTMFPSKFDAKTLDYYIFVPYDDSNSYKDGVKVYFKAKYDDDFKVELDGSEFDEDSSSGSTITSKWKSQSSEVADGGNKTYTITVTDDDLTTTYNIKVYYADANDSSTATLKSLSVKYGTRYNTAADISPEFAAATTKYSFNVPAGTTSVKLIADTTRSKAEMFLNNEYFSSNIVLTDLKAGANVFDLVVMAEDCDTAKTYEITVNVGGSSLTGLTFATNLGTLPVSPAFTGTGFNYIANVANTANVIYVTPTAAAGATITVSSTAGAWQTVTSGATSTAITLKEGLNEIRVNVMDNGTVKTYCLSLYRQPAATKYQVSAQKVIINGTAKDLYAVNINGNNFIKLRDVAYLLNGSSKSINVSFTAATNSAYITSKTAYTSMDGSENKAIKLANPQLSAQKFYLDNSLIYPIAYNINQNNYVNLRQLCAVLDIGLTYSANTNTITLTTANSYVAGQ